jgi:hypothetical protein
MEHSRTSGAFMVLRPGMERPGIERPRIERPGIELTGVERTRVERTGVDQPGVEYGQGSNARGQMQGVECQGPNFTIFDPR